jgi:hypothetical protein
MNLAISLVKCHSDSTRKAAPAHQQAPLFREICERNGSVRFQGPLGNASGWRAVSQFMTELFGVLVHARPPQLGDESFQAIDILWLIGILLSHSAWTL